MINSGKKHQWMLKENKKTKTKTQSESLLGSTST